MKICYSTNDLLKISASLFLLNFSIFDYIVEKLPILDILHNQKQMPTSLYYLIKLDY